MRLVKGNRAGVRRGLSLLEVLASLAIFIISAAALTQMMDSASNAAVRAKQLTKAQLLAETKMNEVVSGALPLGNTSGAIAEENEGWNYSITVTPEDWSSVQDSSTGATVNGLNSVIVTVTFSPPGGIPTVEFSLARLMLDPSMRQPVAPPASSAPSTGSGSGSGAAGGTGGGGTGGGGGGAGGGGAGSGGGRGGTGGTGGRGGAGGGTGRGGNSP